MTERKLEIIGLMAEGLKDQEIADRLCIAYKTVKSHVWEAMRFTKAKNSKHLVAMFCRGELNNED